MPQLKSGRHVALSVSPYLDALASDKDESKYFALVALRLGASTPQALRDHVVIGYFREDQGTPPNAPSYDGYSAHERPVFRRMGGHDSGACDASVPGHGKPVTATA
jgi:hypothetical protein